MRPHGRFAHCSCKNAERQPPVLASCIEIYYSLRLNDNREMARFFHFFQAQNVIFSTWVLDKNIILITRKAIMFCIRVKIIDSGVCY